MDIQYVERDVPATDITFYITLFVVTFIKRITNRCFALDTQQLNVMNRFKGQLA